LKTVRQKNQIICKGKSIKIKADFPTETLRARRAWSEVFQTLKENKCSPRILYQAEISFKIDGEIKVFHIK
jgi:hypothetical protein